MESLQKLAASGVLDASVPDCIVVIVKAYSQEAYSPSQYNDLFSLLLRLFLPDQEVFVGVSAL